MKIQTNLRQLFWSLALAASVLAAIGLSGCVSSAPAAGAVAADVLQSDVARQEPAPFEGAHVPDLVAGNAAFALDLYHVLMEADQNALFSPYSLSVALAMTYAGARGETEIQIAQALHLLDQDRTHPAFNALDQALDERGEQDGVTLHIANALWPQQGYPFLDAYLDLLAENYGAGLRPLDFPQAEAARQTINQWASDQTEEKIQDLLPEGALDGPIALVLTNAVYLDAAWQYAFSEDGTYEGAFNLLDGRQVDVPVMSQIAVLAYAQLGGVQAVELPYVGGELSMVLLVPDADTFEAFAQELTVEELSVLLDALQPAQLRLNMPKFAYDARFALQDALVELGMVDAFGSKADFSGMDGTLELFVDNVYHKAFISVDEAGTEAAAVSAVVMGRKGVSDARALLVDRPFVYLIRDVESGSILFLGHVVDPSA
jgi:serpin B